MTELTTQQICTRIEAAKRVLGAISPLNGAEIEALITILHRNHPGAARLIAEDLIETFTGIIEDLKVVAK